MTSERPRECIKNADCSTGNCKGNICWELNGPYVHCNPRYAPSTSDGPVLHRACAANLKCDDKSNYCVPKDWSAQEAKCRSNADCKSVQKWCYRPKQECYEYANTREGCNDRDKKCADSDACYGGFCRAKCDLTHPEREKCTAVGHECRRVAKFLEHEVCLPKGLAILDEGKPVAIDDDLTPVSAGDEPKPVAASDTVDVPLLPPSPAAPVSSWKSTLLYSGLIGGALIVIIAVLLFLLHRRRRRASLFSD